MSGDLSFNESLLLSIWLEAVLYGFFFCLFCASVYVNVTLRGTQDVHSRTMFILGSLMFILATMHLGLNCFRLIQGFIVHGGTPEGSVIYLGNLKTWDHIFKDTVYGTQEILGDAVAVYRSWILWNKDWRVVAFPIILLIAQMVSGYTVCGLYSTVDPTATVFNTRLAHWITTFYVIAVVQSILTTGLMALRIWDTDRRTASYRKASSPLLPIIRILVESAALQTIVEIILLGLYESNLNIQYILLETVTPLVGITFNAITIRITLKSKGGLKALSSSGVIGQVSDVRSPIATVGSLPMRRIAINITKDVEANADDGDPSLNGKEQLN